MSQTLLRHLESRSAIAARMQALSGRQPNAEQTDFASACLLHGRLFWDSARAASLETKPLLLYYGAAAYAKALVMARRSLRPQDLSQSHGLSCKAGSGPFVGDFSVRANGQGLFQEFNDVVAPLNRIKYYTDSQPQIRVLPTAASAQLKTFEATLLECLSRVTSLRDAFVLCTQQESNVLWIQFSSQDYFGPMWFRIRTDVQGEFANQQELLATANAVCARFPFLAGWNLGEAANAWGKTVLEFDNCPPQPVQPIGDGRWREMNSALCFDPFAAMPPAAGGWADSQAAFVTPIDGQYISEFSLVLAALLALSSIVRYHPHTWTACVHRRPVAGRAIDDSLLPLIVEFMNDVETRFPAFIAEARSA
jgi:YaaC-like Protein